LQLVLMNKISGLWRGK